LEGGGVLSWWSPRWAAELRVAAADAADKCGAGCGRLPLTAAGEPLICPEAAARRLTVRAKTDRAASRLSPSKAKTVIAAAEAAIVMLPESAAEQAGRRVEDANSGRRERVERGGPKGTPGPHEILA